MKRLGGKEVIQYSGGSYYCNNTVMKLVALVWVLGTALFLASITRSMNLITQSPAIEQQRMDHNAPIILQQQQQSWTEKIMTTQISDSIKKQQQEQQMKQKRLEFVHIPKTGGTAIETAAMKQKLKWGIKHFRGQKWIQSTPPWHLTPDHFFNNVTELNSTSKNPYLNATLFAVVRNPYTRIISEYYFRQLAVLQRNLTQVEDSTLFNNYVRNQLGKMKQAKRARMVGNSFERGDNAYYQQNGHFIPQYDYIYSDTQQRMVDYVIHYEMLATEFQSLMKMYNIKNMTLSQERGRSSEQVKKSLSVANLTVDNIRLIDSVYARDFVTFGYPTISTIENQLKL